MSHFIKSSIFGFATVAAFFFAFATPTVASAALCTPSNTVMYVVAHADDALLFQNPDVQRDIDAGKCVSTVFTSAGEAGRWDNVYWLSREDGSKAASAHMAGVANAWTEGDAGIPGHSVPKFTLTANPKISIVFLRLPDGSFDGSGFTSRGYQTLQKLWVGTISSITSNDGSNTYTKQGLTDALLALMNNETPSVINTQDYVGSFGDLDHSDHHATAYFVKAAHASYMTPHTIVSYNDYDSQNLPQNVFGAELTSKEDTFFAYTPFDSDSCTSVTSCVGPYLNWLMRSYTNGSELGGDVCSNIEGNQFSIPEGMVLVEGQCVLDVAPSCTTDISSSAVVSDTSDVVSSGGNAVQTFVPPTWTANIPGATWIWNTLYVADPINGETLTFTKHISIVGTPTSGTLEIASDDNYSASLNGVEFANVSDNNNYATETQDSYDVTSFLHEGDNTLTITVMNIPMGIPDATVNPAGLLYKLSVTKNSCTSLPPQTCPEGTSGTYPACVATPTGSTSGGSTNFDYYGCTNTDATNFNRLANKDDGSCVLPPSAPTGGSTGGNGTTTGEVLGAATTTAELALPAGCTEYIHSYMGRGKKNDAEDVSKLQTFLNETMGAKIPVSGFFGNMTKTWVKKFQTKYHNEIIKPWYDAGYKGKDIENGTGYVYKTTKHEINLMKCSELKTPLPDLSPDL